MAPSPVALLQGVAVTLLPRGSQTLHRAIRKKKHGGYSTVTQEDVLDYARKALVVVDEFSMVDLAFLHDVNARLMALKQSTRPWGGMSICLNGDLFQVRPLFRVPFPRQRPDAHTHVSPPIEPAAAPRRLAALREWGLARHADERQSGAGAGAADVVF